MQNSNFCLQCKKTIIGPSNRLVQDSCGHKKCRVCLLADEQDCSQCPNSCNQENGKIGEILEEKLNNVDTISSSVSVDLLNDTECSVNNRLGVIQCNGTQYVNKANENSVIAKNEDPEETLEETLEETSLEETIDTTLEEGVIPENLEKKKHKPIVLPSYVIEKKDPISYHCTICNRSFITKSHVKYHMYCDGEISRHKCAVCTKEFKTKAKLEIHLQKHKDTKKFACTVCSGSFFDRSNLKRHMLSHMKVKNHTCTECGKSFNTKDHLKIHSLIHQQNKPYSCTICPSKFSNSSNLKKHYITHSEDKVHMCDQCGKRYKYKKDLILHRKTHLRLKPYQCSICSRAFLTSKDLQRHGLTHADTKGFTCSICGTHFRRKDNLNRHMKNAHPGKKGEVIKNFVKLPEVVGKKTIIDNPNAIHVITASPAFTKGKSEAAQSVKSTDSRPGTVIFGPIKLAFKTPAFKSCYNINRNLNDIPPIQTQKGFNLIDSVDRKSSDTSVLPRQYELNNDGINREVCEKILSPYVNKDSANDSLNKEVCQKILSPYATSKNHISDKGQCQKSSASIEPLHYETSFQNQKHAMIKNIKFKVPIQYTQNFRKSEEGNDKASDTNVDSCQESCRESELAVSAASVIVNNNLTSDVHWRRRTSQNFNTNK